MPEIRSKTLHAFSSEDPQFPASNLLEWKVTKKWKCQEAGEKSCFVVLKLDQPRLITGIDIGNERSAFIEVLVANSKQAQPEFKEILLATSFMTITEVKNDLNPNRVRFFSGNVLIESVAKKKWDLVKIKCTQPFNSKIKYGISFVTLHTPEEVKCEDSPEKPAVKVSKAERLEDSDESRKKFGKFAMRANSDSDTDDKKKEDDSPFNRWKSSRSCGESRSTIKEQMTKLEEKRKRIRMLPDSSDEDKSPKPKTNRNRKSGLMYLDEDDEPNAKLQKKLDKDKDSKEKLLVPRDKSPSKSDPKKFSSFLSSDLPSTSSSSLSKSPSRSNSSSHSSRPPLSSHKNHSPKKSSRKDKENEKKSPRKEKRDSHPPRNVTYKSFHKLLEGVVIAFSGYVNPERGTLRQKAIDMGAKYKPDWDNSCTHLICAFSNTPKYHKVKRVGKIVTKRWIEACFSEQKRLSWRRYALDSDDKNEPESEEEIHNVLSKPKSSPPKRKYPSLSGSDDDMVVVDKRLKNGAAPKLEEMKALSSVETPIVIEDPVAAVMEERTEGTTTQDVMEVSTDDEMGNGSLDHTQVENPIFKGKSFYLNEDLSATEIIKLKNHLKAMMGKTTENSSKADYIITESGRRLPSNSTCEILTNRWIHECYDIGALIPTTRYKPKPLQS